jgi:hypothetical protein
MLSPATSDPILLCISVFWYIIWGTLLVTPGAEAVAGGGQIIDTILLRITFKVLLCAKAFYGLLQR